MSTSASTSHSTACSCQQKKMHEIDEENRVKQLKQLSKRIRKMNKFSQKQKNQYKFPQLRQCSYQDMKMSCSTKAPFGYENMFGDIPFNYLSSFYDQFQNDILAQKSFLSQNKQVKSVQLFKQAQPASPQHKMSISTVESLEEISNELPLPMQSNSSKCLEENVKQSFNLQNSSFLSVEFEPACCLNSRYQQRASYIYQSDPILAERLGNAEQPINWMVGHLSEVYQSLHARGQLETLQERQDAFENASNQFLQSEIDSSSEESYFFYVKTFHNYMTGMVENKEIGYSKDLMALLKMSKNISELINSAMRSEIQEIFGRQFQKELTSYLLNNVTLPTFSRYQNSNQQSQRVTAFQTQGQIRSFDSIMIPSQFTVDRINIPFGTSENSVPFVDDYLTIVKINLIPEVTDQIATLRSKLSKRQSFRYRMLFPTMQKRKYKIDKFTKNQQQQQNPSHHSSVSQFLSKFYPQEFLDYENEIASIKIDLETNRSQNSSHVQAVDTICS